MISKDNLDDIHSLHYPIRAFRWLHNQKFDVAFLQETYSSKSAEEIWNGEGKFIIATAPRIQKVS